MQEITEKCYIRSYIFNIFTWLSTRLMNVFLLPYNLFLNLCPRKKCPPIEDKLLLYSAIELAKKIRQEEVKCEDVIRTYMKRIEAVNPIINAVLEDRFNHALRESIEVDLLIKSKKFSLEELEHTKPLLGVPITVKESIAVKGMTHNAGSLKLMYERLRATEDAPVVTAVKKAGGIIMAVTSTPELCMNWETSNKIIGTTCNPYDVRKTPGGSSGGEAALISAGASLIGLGSDTAGSLRIPAHFTGIFAHKPTPGIISIKGHFPYSPDPKLSQYLVVGPMVRYVEDLPLIMDVIAKTGTHLQGASTFQYTPLYKKLSNFPMSDIKILYMLDDGNYLTHKVDKKNCLAIENAVKYFQETYGIQAVKANIKLMKHSVKMANFPLINIKDMDMIINKQNEGLWRELLRYVSCKSKACLQSILLGIEFQLLQDSSFLNRKCEEVEKIAKALREEFRTLLGDNGVLFYPTMTRNARYHNQMFTHMLDTAYCTVFNIIGLPVTNCPILLNSDGMPIGMQVVANPNNDHLTLAVAKELEKAFGGWQPPPFSKIMSKEVALQECTRC